MKCEPDSQPASGQGTTRAWSENSVSSTITPCETNCWNPSAATMKCEPDSQPASGQGIKAEPADHSVTSDVFDQFQSADNREGKVDIKCEPCTCADLSSAPMDPWSVVKSEDSKPNVWNNRSEVNFDWQNESIGAKIISGEAANISSDIVKIETVTADTSNGGVMTEAVSTNISDVIKTELLQANTSNVVLKTEAAMADISSDVQTEAVKDITMTVTCDAVRYEAISSRDEEKNRPAGNKQETRSRTRRHPYQRPQRATRASGRHRQQNTVTPQPQAGDNMESGLDQNCAEAAMATAAASVDAGHRECSICNELFTEPKLLPCGHLLCSHCVLFWITSQDDAKCPLCRSTIVDSQSRGSRSLDDFVDSLPTDLAMRNIADAERILNKEHQWCVCEDAAATSICLTCRVALCQYCTKAHQKFTATKHHCVQTLTSLTADSLAAASSASLCDAHADKPSEVFCSSHNVPICMICATTEHRKCTVVKQEAKMEEAYAVLRELIAFFSRGESEIDKAVQELDDFQKKSEQLIETAVNDAKVVYDKIDALVKEGRQQLTELAQTTGSDNREAAQEIKTYLLNHKGRLTLHKQSAVHAKEIKSCADLNRMTSAVKARMGDLDSSAVLQHDSRIAMAKQVIGREAMSRVEQSMSRVEQSLQQQCSQITKVLSWLRCQHVAFSFHSNHGEDVTLSGDRLLAQKKGRKFDGGIVISKQPMEINHLYEHNAFSFHSNHGDDVTLSGDGLLAQKKGRKFDGGIVISKQPMEINHLYEIQVKSLSVEVGKRKMLLFPGVVTSSPDQLTLPQYSYNWSSAIVVTGCDTRIGEKQIKSSFGKQLLDFKEGSRVGVSLDVSRNLQLHRDGVCLGVVTSSVPQPAHALFDLRGSWAYSFEALPPTRLD